MLFARALAAAGGIALAAGPTLAWVRVEGLALDLDLLGAEVPAIGTTVSGTDTDAVVPLIALGVLAAVLGVRLGANRVARVLTAVIGVLAVLGAAGLAYYAWNLVDIELRDEPAPVRIAAEAAVDAHPREGLALMGAAGVALVLAAVGAPAKRRPVPPG